MTKEEKYNFMIKQLTKIATVDNPDKVGALLQLVAKQTLQEIAGA